MVHVDGSNGPYLNTWALYGLTLSDAVLFDDMPKMRVDQYPIIRRFYRKEPARNTKYVTQLYDAIDAATETCHGMGDDRYGRQLARCNIGALHLNARMVEVAKVRAAASPPSGENPTLSFMCSFDSSTN